MSWWFLSVYRSFRIKCLRILLPFHSAFLCSGTSITCTLDLFSVSRLLSCYIWVVLLFSLFGSIWTFLLTRFIHWSWVLLCPAAVKSIHKFLITVIIFYSSSSKIDIRLHFLKLQYSPQLVWLSGLSAGLQNKGWPIWFPVRTHAWVAGQVPSRGRTRETHWCFSPSLSPSLPVSLKK